MIPSFSLYLFDVDGTLLDSAPDICGAVRSVLDTTPAAGLEFQFLRGYIGRHLYELFDDVLPGLSLDEKADLLARYRTIYLDRKHAATRLYPGVREALETLPGPKSTATTKSTQTVQSILDMFGLLPFFDHVQGTDGFPAKPAPDVIQRSLDRFGIPPAEVLMIGDAPADIAAGRAAGVRTCAVRYGYGDQQEIVALQPDYWIDHLSELRGA